MTIITGQKFITVMTRTGPVSIPFDTPLVGDKFIRVPTKDGNSVAIKYNPPMVGEKYVVFPTRTGPVAQSTETSHDIIVLFGIVVEGDRVYFTNEYANYAQISNLYGAHIKRFGSSGAGDGQFNNPQGIAIGPDGDIYVADWINVRIQRFTSQGVYKSQFSVDGYYAENLAVNSGGHVFTTAYSAGDRGITEFDDAGNFVQHVPPESPYIYYGLKIHPDGGFIGTSFTSSLPDVGSVLRFDTDLTLIEEVYASEVHPLINPYNCDIDSLGNIYVANTYDHNIIKLDSDGTFLLSWGTYGTASGQFRYPTDISIDAENNIYVVDTWNARIQKFTSEGAFITSFR